MRARFGLWIVRWGVRLVSLGRRLMGSRALCWGLHADRAGFDLYEHSFEIEDIEAAVSNDVEPLFPDEDQLTRGVGTAGPSAGW